MSRWWGGLKSGLWFKQVPSWGMGGHGFSLLGWRVIPPTTLPFKFNPWIQRMQAHSWKVMKVMLRKGNLMILAMSPNGI